MSLFFGGVMKKRFKIAAVAASVIFASSAALLTVSPKAASAKTLGHAVTKIAGNGNYAIYHRVSKKGPSGKFTSTKYFKHGQIQSKKYLSTKKGNFWDIYVDGRHIGWVSQNFFARNQISVAKSIDLVNNPDYSFATRDAINYATNSQGTAVSTSKVNVSQAHVSTKSATVNYSYGKAKASVKVNVHEMPEADVTQSPKKGFKAANSWSGGSKGSSRNWNAAHHYRPETKGNTFKSNGLTLTTKLFQPRYISLDNHSAQDAMGIVGPTPEGITIKNGIFVASMYSNANQPYGHLVSYNLNHIKSKTAAQNLTTLKWSTFKSYANNIKVSPYLKLGHGQSLGSSSSYIYVMANDNKYSNGPKSEEILQIRKSDMKVNKIWTFKIDVSTGRYIHNATFTDDNTMYALFHNGRGWYEYWRLDLNNDVWVPTEVGATDGNMVNQKKPYRSPVQGFTYGNGNFYIAFNDNIFKVGQDGTAKKHYQFKTKREIEGLSFSGSRLYTEFAQRSELTSGIAK